MHGPNAPSTVLKRPWISTSVLLPALNPPGKSTQRDPFQMRAPNGAGGATRTCGLRFAGEPEMLCASLMIERGTVKHALEESQEMGIPPTKLSSSTTSTSGAEPVYPLGTD